MRPNYTPEDKPSPQSVIRNLNSSPSRLTSHLLVGVGDSEATAHSSAPDPSLRGGGKEPSLTQARRRTGANQRDRLLLRLPRSPRATGMSFVRLGRSTRRRPTAILILILLKGKCISSSLSLSPPNTTPVILSFRIRYRCSGRRSAAGAAWFKLQIKLRFAFRRLSFIGALPGVSYLEWTLVV